MAVEMTPEKGGTTMKLKKLLALTLAGAVLTASLTACTPLDAAELVYDSIFGGGSSSTGSGNTGSGLTAEEAENRAVAEAYVTYMQSKGSAYKKIDPDYDIPHLEEFVKAIDKYCTDECKTNEKSWEDTVHDLPEEKLEELAAKVGLYKETYGSSRATLRFWKNPSGTPTQQVQQMQKEASICNSFWDTTQLGPYQGDAWFDSVVLTRTEDGSKYRFLLSICHN